MRVAILSIVALALVGCSGGGDAENKSSVVSMPQSEVQEASGDATMASHIVVTKESMRLRLYDSADRLICSFGVALGCGEGDKQEVGDMSTPEGEFVITDIQDASEWLYDSGDGAVKGYYGNWFVRLSSPFKGIGIHGTSDLSSIGQRSTEGSIRLASSDLDSLRPMLREGMKVSINAAEARVAEARAVISTIEPQSVDVVAAEPVAEQSKAVEATKSEVGEVWHTVSDGELLGRIVRSYGTTIAEVKRLNPNINVDRLSIGQRILISRGGEAAPKVESVAPKVVEGDDEVWYTLEKGDLVGRVAQRFGTTSKRIAELNPDINIDRVRDGQRIRIK